MLMLKPVPFHRFFLGLNLSLLASVPVAAQVSPNIPAQVQNTLSKPQIQNLPAEFRPEFRDFNNFNNLGIDNQNNRFVNPTTNPASSPEKTQPQPQPLLTISGPIGLNFNQPVSKQTCSTLNQRTSDKKSVTGTNNGSEPEPPVTDNPEEFVPVTGWVIHPNGTMDFTSACDH